jgi:hypothetical protein
MAQAVQWLSDLASRFHSTHSLAVHRVAFAISRCTAYFSIPHMIKHTLFTMVGLLCALSLRAQSEPQKPPLIGNTPPPPDLHKDSQPKSEAIPPPPPVDISPAVKGEAAKPKIEKNPRPLDPKNMDTSVKPQDDFFMYANGGWIKRTEIPPEYSRWGSFNELIEKNNDALHEIAEKTAKTKVDPKMAPETQKVGDYYGSGMDEKTIEAMRTKPLMTSSNGSTR